MKKIYKLLFNAVFVVSSNVYCMEPCCSSGQKFNIPVEQIREQEELFNVFAQQAFDMSCNFDTWIKEQDEETKNRLVCFAEVLADVFFRYQEEERNENFDFSTYPTFFKKIIAYRLCNRYVLSKEKGGTLIFLPKNYFTVVLLNYYLYTKYNIFLSEVYYKLYKVHDGLMDFSTIKLFKDNFEQIVMENSETVSFFGHNVSELEFELFFKILRDYFNKVSQIKILDLNRCNLGKIYGCIKNFKNLEILDISYNNLSEFPKPVLSLSKLKTLLLGTNNIRELTTEFFSLKNLENIDLSYNEFELLPNLFALLVNLTKLNLMGNKKLKELPAGLSSLIKSENDYLNQEMGLGFEIGLNLQETPFSALTHYFDGLPLK